MRARGAQDPRHLPEGTVRFSFGNFSTKDQVDVAVQAILALADYAAENKED